MICLDTAVLIWGVRGFASRTQEHEIERAARYIRWLRMKDKKVMIPCPVLAEYLVGATATELHEMAIFELGFEIPPFDIPAARITADLMRDVDLIKTIKKDHAVDHQCIKVDAMIIAIAICRRAEKIITSDKDFHVLEKLAGGKVIVSPIPDIPLNIDDEQKGLFRLLRHTTLASAVPPRRRERST